MSQMARDKVGPNLKTVTELGQSIPSSDIGVSLLSSKFIAHKKLNCPSLFIGPDNDDEHIQTKARHYILQPHDQTVL
jgi:hypothetical protein